MYTIGNLDKTCVTCITQVPEFRRYLGDCDDCHADIADPSHCGDEPASHASYSMADPLPDRRPLTCPSPD